MIPSGNTKRSSNELAVSSSENKKRAKTSKYKGVFRKHGEKRWTSEVSYRYQTTWLGRYHQEEAAALAYDAAQVCLHGSQPEVLCELNFPDMPPNVPKKEGQPFSPEEIREQARKHANRQTTGPIETPPHIPTKEGQPFSPKEIKEQARKHANSQTTGPIETPPDIPSKGGQPLSPNEIKEQARKHTNWKTTGPIEVAADTTEPCNKNPIDRSCIDEGYPAAD